MPPVIEKGLEKRIVIRNWEGQGRRAAKYGCSTGKGINTFITKNTDMTGHPAKRDRFVSNREPEEPVLDFPNKRMGRTGREKESKRVPGVSEEGKGRGGVGQML